MKILRGKSIKREKRNLKRLASSIVLITAGGVSMAQNSTETGIPADTTVDRSLEGVEVVANRNIKDNVAEQPKSWSTMVSKITSLDIENIGATNLSSALKYTLGGEVREQGRKHKEFFYVRGQSSEYAIDGMTLMNFYDGPTSLSTDMLEEIEVTRSSNSLAYGGTGLNSSVNLKTKYFDKTHIGVNASYGTFNTTRASAIIGDKIKGLRYVASVTRDDTDGPKDLNGAEHRWNLYGKVRFDVTKKIYLEYQQFYITGSRQFLISQDNGELIAANKAQTWKYDPQKIQASIAKVHFDEGKFGSTEFRYYYYADNRKFDNGNKVSNESLYTTDFSLVQTVNLCKNNTMRLAGDYYIITGENYYNTSVSIGKREKMMFAFIDEHKFKRGSIDLGVKYIKEHYSDYNGVADEWQPGYFNGNIGFTLPVSKNVALNLVGSIGRIAAPVNAMTKDSDGNPINLQDEKRKSVELGSNINVPCLGMFTVTGYFHDSKNAYTMGDEEVPNSTSVSNAYYYTVNDLKRIGIEVGFKSKTFFNSLSGFANASECYIEEETGVKYKGAPQFIASAGLTYSKYGATLNIMGRYVSEYINNRFVKPTSPGYPDTKIGDYYNFDANLTYKIPVIPVSVYGDVKNIFNKKYCTMSPVYPDQGTRLTIGLKFNI